MLCNTNSNYHFWQNFSKPKAVLIIKTKKELDAHLSQERKAGKRIGLIPTMGALHQGHLSLLDYIKASCEVTVCSIFVNPTQFNNPDDLQKYPRPIEADIAKLKSAGCDVLFLPEVEEMYSNDEEWHLDLGMLESVLEGAFRPGHFKGVTQIVSKLFNIVKPHIAVFGQKDYQQFMVVKRMVELLNLPVELSMCPVIREESGLAMSSRNVRLSDIGKQKASSISRSLNYIKQAAGSNSIGILKQEAVKRLEAEGIDDLEYFEICDPETLEPIANWETGKQAIALVAVWIEGVRLIDNVMIDLNQQKHVS